VTENRKFIETNCMVCYNFIREMPNSCIRGVPKGRVYSRRLVFVSVKTIKRHHHHEDVMDCVTSKCPLEGSEQGDLDFLDFCLCGKVSEVLGGKW
jgi:hypothetical protein